MNRLKFKASTSKLAILEKAFPTFAAMFDETEVNPSYTNDDDNFIIYGKLAVIRIEGILVQDATDFEKAIGCYDIEDIKSAIEEAEGNPLVEAIVLFINSPGGLTNGCVSTFEAINQASKPVYAFTSYVCASAAYWIASGAKNGVYATRDAIVGSVGVYCYVTSEMSQDAANNLSPVLIKAGKYKAMGIAPLSPDEIQIIQGEVDGDRDEFIECVNTERSISEDDLQGLDYKGAIAIEKGFIDDVYNSLEEFCDFLNED